MNELSLQKLDGLQLKEVVEQERPGVGERGHDAPLGLFARLRGVLGRVGAQEHDHDLGSLENRGALRSKHCQSLSEDGTIKKSMTQELS